LQSRAGRQAPPTGIQLSRRRRAAPFLREAEEAFRKGSAASHLSVDDFDPAYFESARHLHASGVCCALSDSTMALARHAMEFIQRAGRSVSFDPNLRPTLWPTREAMVEGINGLAAKADWVLPGIAEGRILTPFTAPGEIARFYLDRGAQLVALKLGSEGAYFRTPREEGTVAAMRVEQVVDTVGAGDGFAVGVVSALLEGLDPGKAVARGNRIGAMAIQVVGDMEGLPTRRELDIAEGR
jgi:2-dehydro-3-deoxygluconokinase